MDFDLCPKCRTAKTIYQVVLGKNPEDSFYCAGLEHAAERILEEAYWEYTEFGDEWNELVEHHHYADPLAYFSAYDPEDFEQFKADLAEYVRNLQSLWEYGVERGLLETNKRPRPESRETFCEWPTKFEIEIYARTLAELIENGVCEAR